MPKCIICGEPMPEDQKMFKFHGMDGNNCPKPPLTKRIEVLAEYKLRETREGDFWIDVEINRCPHESLGPFETESECRRAYDDLVGMMRSQGAIDIPKFPS